jgi:hypothetical protein
MQVKKIAALCAVACASMAGTAQAALPGATVAGSAYETVKEARLAGRVFFISGASATQKGFNGIIATLFSGTPYRIANTTASSKDYEAVAGVMAVGPWAGQTAIIIDRVKGGSVFGVNPVARDLDLNGIAPNEGEPIEGLHVHEDDCSGTGSGTSATPYVCENTTADAKPMMVPDAGISDVAPRHFLNPHNTEGEVAAAALSEQESAEFADTTFNKPIYALSFGVPVTNNISPRLTRASVAGIMTGPLGNWNQVDSSMASDDIVVCRRVQGSGTQAVDNLYFGGFSCSDSLVNAPAARDATTAWNPVTGNYTITAGSGYQVIENSTSGDVRNCLVAAANPAGASYTTKDRDGVTKTVTFGPKAGGHKAIGVLSMDSLGSSNATAAIDWSYRSLDGVGRVACEDVAGCTADTSLATTSGTGRFPLKASLKDGTWDLQGWISWNVPIRTSNDPVKGGVAQEFITAAQDPAILGSVNDLKNVALALPAPFSSYAGANVSDVQYVLGNQCGPLFKQ